MNESMLETMTRIWDSLGVFAVSGARIIGIVLVALLAMSVSRRALKALRGRIAVRQDDPEAIKRGVTINRVLLYLTTVVISLIAFIAVLSEFGVSVAPFLGAAGIVGLAVGFGAQSLVKDYVTGLFLLLENQIRLGDVVQLGEHSGTVEEVTLRYVRLRDYSGNVYFIPNGTITTVINMSRGFSNAVIDIGVTYAADLDQVMQVMREVAAQLRLDPRFAPQILDDLEIAGVQDWADSSVKIRARIRVVAQSQWAVRRAYLMRLKQGFDAHGIEIPFPQLTVHRNHVTGPTPDGPAHPTSGPDGGGDAVSRSAAQP